MSEVLAAAGVEGRDVGRFRLGEVLGRGGMATVYRAYDTVAEREVAVKVLYEHFREHPFVVERFKQEVQIAQGLEHPNIVRVYQLLETPEVLGLVMDLHGSGDLKAYVQRHGPMDYRQVVVIAEQVLGALSMAHARGIVHQDIKPHNILWDPVEQVAKLIDFGLAEVDEAVALARPESAMGTVEYSAPEQFDDFGVDGRADLYSLGVTLFEMLSGSLPYRSETAAGVIQMHRTAPAADVRVFVRGVPGHVANALLRAMAKLPEERFESADEMRGALVGETQRSLRPRRSDVWEVLKARHREEIESHDWNVYLPRWVTHSFIVQDVATQKMQARKIVEVFRKHQQNYCGSFALDGRVRPGQVTDDFMVLSKRGGVDPTQGRGDEIGRVLVPFACRLTKTEAEQMCRDLGEVGILARSFQGALRSRSEAQEDLAARSVSRFRIFLILLAALGGVSVILVWICVIIGHDGGALEPGTVLAVMLSLYVGMLGQGMLTGYGEKVQKVTTKYSERLGFSDDYLLQFRRGVRDEAAGYLVGEEHAAVYYAVRSSRVRGTYEQLLLKMIRQGKRTEVDEGWARVLEHATRITERIAELEKRLTNQNQAVLFEQLARLDAQLAQVGDVDQSAAIIEQKVALTEQLRVVDEERREMVLLGQELTRIGGPT